MTNWDTSAYNAAINNAIAWAKAMEATNATYTVKRIADSDGQIRLYQVGDAVIKVSLTGGTKSNAVECGSSKSYNGGTYTSASASDAVIKSNDSGRLGSGWSYTKGQLGTGGGYVAGSNGHDGECPGHGTDEDGNENPCDCTPHSCGSFTSGRDITQGASAAFQYTITVTFKNGKVLSGGNYDGAAALAASAVATGASLPAHALCGPCCEHTLPAVEDKWTQVVWFDTLAISDMQIWKLESGYVQGVSEILEGNAYYEENAVSLADVNARYDAGASDAEAMALSDRVYSAVTQSDPNIFYNIASKNADEKCGTYNTSKAGRLRYSMQTGQDDTVYYEEKNEKGELHRSNKCDGMAKTKSKNPVVSGGNGHKGQPWAAGCLYDNHVFVNGIDYHKVMADDLKTGYNDQALAAKKTDTVDQKTEEWKRFDTRRNQKVTVSIISDFLILQTSSGDQSVLYHEGKSKTVATQENFGEVNVDTDASNAAGFTKLVTANTLAMKQGAAIHIGSYNGHYATPDTKYRGTGQGVQIATAFDRDAASYNNITDELGKAEVTAGHTVTASSNRNISCAALQERLPRVNGLIITKSGIIQCPTNVNKEYTTGESYAFYKPIIKYTDDGKRYASTTREADAKEQEAQRNNPADQEYKQYVKLHYSKTSYVAAGYSQDKDNLLEDEVARSGGISPDQEEECRYLKAVGAESYGILLNSVYTKGKSKCNDIVVHDPISADQARVMRADGQGDDLDQRTAASILEVGSAKDLNQSSAEAGSCPGTPGECNFRELHCKYGMEIVKAAFTVDAYQKVLITEETDADVETSDKTDAETDYRYTIYSSVVNDNGGTPGFSINGSGFSIRSDSGDIPPSNQSESPEGTNYRLVGTGKASLPFAFYKMNIDSSNTAERVKVGADIMVNTATRMPVLSTDHIQLFVDADGYLSVETDDGAKYRSPSKVFTVGTMHRLELSICFGTISDFSVAVDGAITAFTQKTAPTVTPYEEEVCAPDFYLGNTKDTAKYDVNFSADNIQVTRLAGSTAHTDACYRIATVHASTVQDTYNGINGNTIDWTRTADDGANRITSVNNSHTHTENCLTSGSKGFAIAYENGMKNARDLEKMVGPTLWGKIVKQFGLKADSKGIYTLGGNGSNDIADGDVYDYAYSGSVQQVTLPAGTYLLEAWGAQGGSALGQNAAGKNGGYTKGTLTLTKTTALYLVIGGKGGDTTASIDGYNAYNNNGGYNGGGSGTGSAGPGGGGATHIATSSTVLSRNGGTATSISGLLMIAGGGGAGNNGSGVYGNYTYMNGANGYLGWSGSYEYDNGGGGAGYLGGSSVSGDDPRYGYSGSSFADSKKLSDCSVANDKNSGNGKAKITVLSVNQPIDKNALFTFIKANQSLIPDTVSTNGKTITNPIWDCRCVYDRHTCTNGCKKTKELKCSEPHHEGHHYDYSSQICYDACCRDENHKQYQTEIIDEKGNIIRADDFILLDNYFDVYFPNIGNFQGIGSYGIADTQIERGMGYTAMMDTTEWTREKWIKFPYSVLYNRNGIWEEHMGGEWFQIEIFDTAGTALSTYHFYCQLKNDEMGSGKVEFAVEAVNHENTPGETEKMTTTAFYHERHKNALWPYERDTVMTVYGPTDGSASTNRTRYGVLANERYWAYEDCWSQTWIDVIGRIGNLLMEDTDDIRFTNLFKETTDEGWLIDGILKTVDPASPSHYLSWWKNDGTTAVDLRGEKVSRENEWYNTYQTMPWANKASSVPLPLQADRNTVKALKNAENELRLGYDVLWDISSIGNYGNGTLQVIPYYYALNIKTGALTPVDVYIDSGDKVQPINYFHLVDDLVNAKEGTPEKENAIKLTDSLYSYNMTLNWSEESGRRNYSKMEKEHTESLASDNNYGSFAYDADGNMVMRPVTLYNEENGTYSAGETPLVYNLTIPYGNMDFVLGTEQLLYISCEPTATGNDGGQGPSLAPALSQP